jgi:hypothetical protein
VRIDRLEAECGSRSTAKRRAQGRLRAAIVQSCAISGEDLPVAIDEPLALRFVPETPVAEDEIELDEKRARRDSLRRASVRPRRGGRAEPRAGDRPVRGGPEAERVRKEAGLARRGGGGPFAALAALRRTEQPSPRANGL